MYREDKTTQMAASFLKLAKGRMPSTLLMTMLYVADKKMLLKWGKPISYDQWCSRQYGPVLSHTLGLIHRQIHGAYWSAYIETDVFDAVMVQYPGTDLLSRAEDRIIVETFEEWGHLEPSVAAARIHDPQEFPEYIDPGKGAIPIGYHEVLKYHGVSGEEIANILENIDAHDALRLLVGAQ